MRLHSPLSVRIMKKLLVIWLAAFYTTAHGYVALEGMEGGACINAKLQDNFDINKFQGVWYEAQSAPNMFQLTKKCTKMEYIWNGNVVKATTTGLGEEDQPTEQSTDMTKSARNVARFLVRVPEMPELEVPFDILSTDYNSYACVYSCLKYENFKAEFTWALTRDNSKLTGAGAICKRAFQNNNIDTSKLADTYHGSLCSAPPKTSSGSRRKSGLPPPNRTIGNQQNNKNSKEKKRKYNWTPNNASWKPYTPRTKQKDNNEVNYNARSYNGYQRGNQPTVTNVRSTIQKKTRKGYTPYTGYSSTKDENTNKPTLTKVQSTIQNKSSYKPYDVVKARTESKGYNPYIGYRSIKKEDVDNPTVTNVQSTRQKKTTYKPYQSVEVKKVNKGYIPYSGYRSKKKEKNNKSTATNIQITSQNVTPAKPIQRIEVKKENKGYNPFISNRSTKEETTNKLNENANKGTDNTQKSNSTVELETENKEKHYVGYRGRKRVNTNKADKPEKDIINKVSPYNGLKNSNEETLILKDKKEYRSNWGTTYGVRRQNAWGVPAKQNDDAKQVEKARRYRGYKSRKVKEKPKQKVEGYRSRNPPRKNWSTIESIKVDRATSSINKPKIKQTMVKNEVAVSGCKDNEKSCGYWATSGECNKNPLWMNSNCQKSCGKCDKLTSSSASSSSSSLSISSFSKSCSDKDSGCQGWANTGECKKNPRWMNFNCPRVCGQCS